jgi:hypothetical protein
MMPVGIDAVISPSTDCDASIVKLAITSVASGWARTCAENVAADSSAAGPHRNRAYVFVPVASTAPASVTCCESVNVPIVEPNGILSPTIALLASPDTHGADAEMSTPLPAVVTPSVTSVASSKNVNGRIRSSPRQARMSTYAGSL